MAWKVYGFMEGHGDGTKHSPYVYGPLPCKRWIKAPGDKKRRIAVTNGTKAAIWSRDDQARKGIEYARWLAARDGITLPDGTITPCWATVDLPTGKTQARISCVTFGTNTPRVRIDIPNWNFVPRAPVLEINADYFSDMLSAAFSVEAEELEAA